MLERKRKLRDDGVPEDADQMLNDTFGINSIAEISLQAVIVPVPKRSVSESNLITSANQCPS